MSRWVTGEQHAMTMATSSTPPTGKTKSAAVERIAKYIPGEILAGYTALYTVLLAMNPQDISVAQATLFLIAIFFITTIAYLINNNPDKKSRMAHLIVSPLAFLVWSYAISSASLGAFYVPLYAFFGQVIVIALSIIIVPKPITA